MSEARPKEVVSEGNQCPNEYHNGISLALSECEGASNASSNVLETKAGLNGYTMGIQNRFEQLIGQGFRDFINAPQNSSIIAGFLAQHKGQDKQQRPSVIRDISNSVILRPRDLRQATGLSRTSIWRLEKDGKFVKKLKLSNGCVGYFRTDVELWLASKQQFEGGK